MARLLAALVLAVIASACEPPQRAKQPPSEPAEEWQTQPASPEPTTSESTRCAAELTAQSIRRAQRLLEAVTNWASDWMAESNKPLRDQLQLTPWDEIPRRAQSEIEKLWQTTFRQNLARQASALGVPVSSMGCKPEYPDCDKLDPHSEGIGPLYASLFAGSAAELVQAGQDVVEGLDGFKSFADESQLWAELARHSEREGKLLESYRAMISLLPRSAVGWFRPVTWPEIEGKPLECRRVLKD